MATQLNQSQIRSQTESLKNKGINIMQRLKSIAVSRAVVAGNTQASQENDSLIAELQRVEEEIKELKSSFEKFIKKAKEDVLTLRQNIPRIGGSILRGQVTGRLEMQKMASAKEAEISFLNEQIKILQNSWHLLNAEDNKKYRYRYRIVERSQSGIDYIDPARKNLESIRIEPLNLGKTGNHGISFVSAFVKENRWVRIVNIERDNSLKGQRIGNMLLEALENQFNEAETVFYLANGTNKNLKFWKLMGFQEIEYDDGKTEYLKIRFQDKSKL